MNDQNRQRVIAIELTATDGGNSASSTLMLPFGLTLGQGAVLSVDEGEALPPLQFSTYLPAPCLVPFTFSQDTVSAMRVGGVMNVKAAAHGNARKSSSRSRFLASAPPSRGRRNSAGLDGLTAD